MQLWLKLWECQQCPTDKKKTNVLNRFRLWHQPTMGKDINSQGKEIIH